MLASSEKIAGLDLVQSGEGLSLTNELEVDTIILESRAFLGDDAGLIVVSGEILEQYDYADCSDFNEWLTMQRERWRSAREGVSRRTVKSTDSSRALESASEWVDLEPLSEEASRALARSYRVRGNCLLRWFPRLLNMPVSVSPMTFTGTCLTPRKDSL
jgi:DNA-binding SARP family transcriptional activator